VTSTLFPSSFAPFAPVAFFQGVKFFLFSISGDNFRAFFQERKTHGAPQATGAARHQN